MSEKKVCNECKRSISPLQFYNSNSSLFSDGKVPFCKSCLKKMMPEDDIDAVKKILRQIDKPFLIEIWKTAEASTNNTIGEYFRAINSLHQYRDLTWEDSIHYDNDNSIVENEIKKASEEGTQDVLDIQELETDQGVIKVTKELKSKWGNYSNRDIIEMERLFKEMERANDISSPQHKKDLHFYCKLSTLADKALDEGDFSGYEKLSRQLDLLKKSAGFRPIDRLSGSESSGIKSFSQVYETIEKDGFIEPYPIQERQDIVDRTIMYMLNYQLKLHNKERLVSPPHDTPKLKEDEILVEKEGDSDDGD
jgi:hypothetical protein